MLTNNTFKVAILIKMLCKSSLTFQCMQNIVSDQNQNILKGLLGFTVILTLCMCHIIQHRGGDEAK